MRWIWAWAGIGILALGVGVGCPGSLQGLDDDAGDDDAGDDDGGDDDAGDDDGGDDDTGDDDAGLVEPGPFDGLGSFTDDVYEVTELDPWTVAIRELEDWYFPVMYLVAGNDQALLIDTGRDRGDLAAVIEGFYDGAVFVLASDSRWPNLCGAHRFDEVYLFDNAYAHDYMYEWHGGGRCWGDQLLTWFDVTDWIDDGFEFDPGARPLEVIHTPGHTSDSVAVWDETLGWLFTGWTLYPSETIDVANGDSDFDAYRASLDQLQGIAAGAEFVSGARGWDLPNDKAFVGTVRDGASAIDGGTATGYVYGTVTYYPFDGPPPFALDVGNWLHDEPFVDGNLTILGFEAAVDQGTGHVHYDVLIENTGPEDILGGFYVDVYGDHPQIPPLGDIGEGYTYVAGLAAGEQRWIDVVIEDGPGVGTWTSWVRVDTDQWITETDESDNEFGPLTVES